MSEPAPQGARALKFDTREPCAKCPYRRDAPLALWDREHFTTLVANDRNEFGGAVYGCHATRKLPEPSVCAGWLLDQIKRGLPSIQLRLALVRAGDVGPVLDAVSDVGHELYDSIGEMVEANEEAYAEQAP